mgnify:CR=1 FL=1
MTLSSAAVWSSDSSTVVSILHHGFSKATFASAFVSLLACAAAVEVPKTDYEVIVVGGGPAGLSALSGVSRVRRTALLIDSQEYRNGVTREMHDVIGNDGEIGS